MKKTRAQQKISSKQKKDRIIVKNNLRGHTVTVLLLYCPTCKIETYLPHKSLKYDFMPGFPISFHQTIICKQKVTFIFKINDTSELGKKKPFGHSGS